MSRWKNATELISVVEESLSDLYLYRIRASGVATGENSYYPPLTNQLQAVGSTFKPKLPCVCELAQQGDLALYNAKQVHQLRPRQAKVTERRAEEIKAACDDAKLTTSGGQVSRFWSRYRRVLESNTRNFVLISEDKAGNPVNLETVRL